MHRHQVKGVSILRREARFKSTGHSRRFPRQPDDPLPNAVTERLAPAPQQALEQVAHPFQPLDASPNFDQLWPGQRLPSG
jgi:hypothetical protein